MNLTKKELEGPAEEIAQRMLGARLWMRKEDPEVSGSAREVWVSGIITETEAYVGPHDTACHAHKGRTKRTEVMFGEAGQWYVYLCYGVHWMLNLVVGEEDYPAAVLIRGVTPKVGPGRVTKHFGITGEQNGVKAAKENGLWIDWAEPLDDGEIQTTPRIGIDYAGEPWVSAPLRFLHKDLWKAKSG